jgi:hypothetical protein
LRSASTISRLALVELRRRRHAFRASDALLAHARSPIDARRLSGDVVRHGREPPAQASRVARRVRQRRKPRVLHDVVGAIGVGDEPAGERGHEVAVGEQDRRIDGG